jgi:integrase
MLQNLTDSVGLKDSEDRPLMSSSFAVSATRMRRDKAALSVGASPTWRRISPHVLRHACAMIILHRSGIDTQPCLLGATRASHRIVQLSIVAELHVFLGQIVLSQHRLIEAEIEAAGPWQKS